jgi:hypothetical protein
VIFPSWTSRYKRFAADLDGVAQRRGFRLGIACFLALFHLAMFARAGHERIGVAFDSHPDDKPYFSDPDAPATRGYPRQPHHWSRLVVSRWDAQHYIGTAERGLTACPHDPATATNGQYLDCGLGWLPAWGTIGGTVSSVTSVASDWTLVWLSVACLIVFSFLWTSDAIVSRFGRFEAYMMLIGFHAFPTAFYGVTPYPEAACLALSLGGFVALSKDRWVLAGALIGLATAFKLQSAAYAVGFGCAALLAAWRKRRAGDASWWRPLAAIPLAGWGIAAEFLLIRVATGDLMAFMHAREAFGDKRDWSRLVDFQWFFHGFSAQHRDIVIYLAVVAIIALTVREVVRRLSPEQAAYLLVTSVFSLVIIPAAPLHYWGINRYLLAVPLVFFGMGVLARRHAAAFVLWLFLSLQFYWHIEMCSYVAQGDETVCPCLGTKEFSMKW